MNKEDIRKDLEVKYYGYCLTMFIIALLGTLIISCFGMSWIIRIVFGLEEVEYTDTQLTFVLCLSLTVWVISFTILCLIINKLFVSFIDYKIKKKEEFEGNVTQIIIKYLNYEELELKKK